MKFFLAVFSLIALIILILVIYYQPVFQLNFDKIINSFFSASSTNQSSYPYSYVRNNNQTSTSAIPTTSTSSIPFIGPTSQPFVKGPYGPPPSSQ